MSIPERLAKLGFDLPQPSKPVGNYQPWLITGDLVFISGQFARLDGLVQYPGQLGREISDADGYKAAQLAALNLLAQLQVATDEFQTLDRLVRLDGYLNCAPDWNNHAVVLDGASDLLVQILAKRSGHTRTVCGQSALPQNASVELAAIATVRAF